MPGEQQPGEVAARVVANFSSTIAVQIEGTEQLEKAYPLNHLPLLVTGDIVRCRRDEDILRIETLQARNSVLERADRYTTKPLASNLTHLGIVAANPPGIDTLLIDQFCVGAYRSGISPLIIFNKRDRMGAEELRTAKELCEVYVSIGYSAVIVDTKTERGLQLLLDQLPERVIALVGASGVGKSSIIKHLLPDKEVRVGALSESKSLGKHTTSVTFWYALPNNGAIIDSPGVRQYSVAHLDQSTVKQGFPEVADAAVHCRFGDCSHNVEPDCAVVDALNNGEIAHWRYDNYLRLIEIAR